MTKLSHDDLCREVDELSEGLDRLRRSQFVFWISLFGTAPAGAGTLMECAAAIYGEYSEVTAVAPLQRSRDWMKEIRASIRRMGHYDHLFGGERRDEPEFLIDWLFALIEDTLGSVRVAATVSHQPQGWWGAIWEDWLLITDEWATVLSLVNDS